MDSLSFFGLIAAFVAIIGGQYLEGGSVSALINGPAFLIVIGGSLAAVMIQTPIAVFRNALSQLKWVLFPPKSNFVDKINSLREYSIVVRTAGVIGLERVLMYEKDPILIKGLQSIADGVDPKIVKEVLDIQIESDLVKSLNAAKVYESLGAYSPTIGVIGAVLGLIQVMSKLTSPESLGSGIAVAFVATIYGIAFANLLCLPVYKKLRAVSERQLRYRAMLVQGIVCVAVGNHPNVLEAKLRSYISE